MAEGETSRPVRRVGFVGVGRMGRPMCRYLLDAGFELTVYDPVEEAVQGVADAGAAVADSAAGVARASDVVIVMVGYPDEAQEAVLGDNGLLKGAQAGSVIVMGSTVSPEKSLELAQHAENQGARFVDAPVCRGERGAIERNLLWLVGGAGEDVETCRPVMVACGKDIYHLGGIGAGQVGKAVNNMLLWAALCADHEGFALARAYGVNEEMLRSALVKSSAINWPLIHWEDMQNIPWAQKDMVITLEMADKHRLSLPIAGLVREEVKKLLKQANL